MRSVWATIVAAVLLLAWAVPGGAGELRIGRTGTGVGLDPHRSVNAADLLILGALHAALVDEAGDGVYAPALATEWTRLDARTWRFALRPDARFQNGRPVEPADVVFSFCRALAARDGSGLSAAMDLEGLRAVRTLSANRLELVFDGPMPQMPAAALNVYIIARPVEVAPSYHPNGCGDFADYPPKAFDEGLAVGAGAYLPESYAPGLARILRYDRYWGPSPDWPSVELHSLPAERLAHALLEGSLDVVTDLAPASVSHLAGREAIRVTAVAQPRLVYLHFNHAPIIIRGGEQFTNTLARPAARKALSLAIDRAMLADRVLRGFAHPTVQMVLPGMEGFDPHLAEKASPDLARSLLGSDPVVPLRLLCLPRDERMADTIAHFLGQVGLDVRVEVAEGQVELMRRLAARDFELSLGAVSFSARDAVSLFSAIIGSPRVAGQGGELNWGLYRNVEADDLLVALRTLAPGPDRDRASRRLAALVAAERPVVPLWFKESLWAARSDILVEPRHNVPVAIADIRSTALNGSGLLRLVRDGAR